MDLTSGLIRNLLSSLFDKAIVILSQFATLFLMVRLLPREAYGMWGIALSLFVFIHFINIGCEAILYREHRNYEGNESTVLASFFHFATLKCLVFFIIAYALSLFYPQNQELLWALFSMAILMGGEAWVAGMQTFFIIKLRQDLVARASFFKALLSLLFLLGLYFFPSLKYVFFKEFIVAVAITALYLIFLRRHFNIPLKALFLTKSDWKFTYKSIRRYSLWVHLIGVTTNFIYKADIFFLSLFAPMLIVGNYTIALNSANFANILPALLGQQASVALGHLESKDKAIKITHLFIRWSVLLSLATIIAFALFGKLYLRLMTGESDVNLMFFYLLCIVGGLVIVKTFASPIVAYLNILSDVKRLFWRVNLPILVISGVNYYLFAAMWRDQGVAYANIVNSLFWVLFVLYESHQSGFCWNGFFDLSLEKKLISRWRNTNV